MRIKFYFFILVLFLLGLGGALIYLAGKMQTTHLYVVEGIIVFILLYLAVFYRKIVKPMSTIGSGMELLREQDFSSRLSRVGQYEADRIVNVFNRMMEQLKNERLRMREQNHFLDLLIQASPMGVVIMTLDGEVSQLNPMAVKMLGVRLEEAQNRKLDKIDSPLAEELASIPKETTSVVRLNDANIYKCTHSSFIDRGFKHPFFLIERMTDEVMKAEKRAYEKVKIPEPTVAQVQLNELVSMCKRFMEGMCNDRNIILRLECDPEVGQVRLDASLFEQVLVNIIKNAAESIESAGEAAGKQGEITVRTTAPALIEIVDNGPGISKETEAKLFSPFFSTKPNGQGIGLVFIREVLSRHGCAFSLRTYNDGLTRFRILFN